VLEVLKALADRQLAAGTVREEDLEAVHHTVREEVQEARRTGQEVVRHTGLDVARRVQCDVAEAAGSLVEDGHRIDRVEDLEEDHRSLLGTAGLVVGRSRADRGLAAGVEEAGHSLVEEEVGRNRLGEAEGHRRRSSQTCCPLLMFNV
jgi:hypothetical protein